MPRRHLLIVISAFCTLVLLGFTGLRLAVEAANNAPPATPGPEELWPNAGPWAEARLSELTLEQKVSQLFATNAYGFYTSEDDPAYKRLVDLIERFQIGGVIFFQGEPFEQATLANDLQARSRLPLLVSQDMEWGAGMRVEHATTFPRAMAVGAARSPAYAYAAGLVTAREARALGVQQVYAPVADVNNNPYNPIINVRSYSERPALVAELVTAFARGLKDGGVIATAKHFPGHGDTATDSHADLPVLPINRARLDTLELVPFRAAIAGGIGSIMTGHLAFPLLEADANVPATLSPSVTSTLLRQELGFQGLIVTDALNMHGVMKHFSPGEAAVRALQAGADLLLMSTDEYAARTAILDAIATGRLTEARIDRSVRRLLLAKESLGLHQERLVDVDALREVVATRPHLMTADAIARASLTLLRNENDLLPLRSGRQRMLNVVLSDDDDAKTGTYFTARLQEQAGDARIATRVLDSRARPEDYKAVLKEATSADVVVVPAFVRVRSWSGRISLSDEQTAFINDLVATGTPVILLSFGNPYIAMGLTSPAVYIAAYGHAEASQLAAAQALFGRSGFHGRLPITIPGEYPFGAGLTLDQVAVREGFPEEVGLDGDRLLPAVDSLLHRAVDARAFPGAAVAIGRAGVTAVLKGYGYFTYMAETPVTPRSRFDLASLTKVIATTTAVMKLYEEGRLDLDAPVARYLPGFGQNGKEAVTLRHLLTHTSGLIPYRPFHRLGITTPEGIVEAIYAEELQYAPGTESRYSDFGPILLGLIVERLTERTFADYARAEIFEPLGMFDTGFLPTERTDLTIVPTEVDTLFRKRLVQGEVHDETAWILGGTAGHAGLFSTAEDLSRFAYMLVHEGRVHGKAFLQPETVRLFTTAAEPGKHTRALGWDTRSPEGYSSAGTLFGPRSFGHTGFTGTSFWIDPDQDLFVILLTNRVYPTRDNRAHIPIRAALADLAAAAIAGPPAPLLPVLSR